MKKSKVLIAIFFLITFGFVGIVAGFAISSLFISKGSGLAGPAIALGYGLLGLVVTIIVGGILVKLLSYEKLRVALYISATMTFITLSILIYRVVTLKQNNNENIPEPKKKVTEPVSGSLNTGSVNRNFLVCNVGQLFISEGNNSPITTDEPLGVGIVKPDLTPGKTLYFYNKFNLNETGILAEPYDSITFVTGEHFTEIGTAPSWFYPDIMKLDYDLLLLRAITLSKNMIEVVVNKETGRTIFVDRFAVSFIDWNSFLLDVFSVEVIDLDSNPVRVKPLDHAGLVIGEDFDLMQPVAVKGSWLQVRLNESKNYGWVRWRKNDKLVIRYYLLS